jgi:GAF domain-containing protein
MIDERRRRIESLCRQIEIEQDQNVFIRLVMELNQLLETDELQSGFAAKSKLNGNGHQRADNQTTVFASSYEKIVDDAVAVMRSDYASVQMLFPERGTGGELRLLAFRGFNPEAAKFWEWVRADSKSTCGIALRETRRVVAPDIAVCDFMADSEDQQVYLQTGIHACQTTPLIARAGNVVGMISTHWRTPHQPSEGDFNLFDVLARQAADLIERCRQEEALYLARNGSAS